MLADPLESKREKVTSIIKRFPLRKFILVGDSGEKDPEVYAKVERAYHNQVIAIYIRNVLTIFSFLVPKEILFCLVGKMLFVEVLHSCLPVCSYWINGTHIWVGGGRDSVKC